MPAHLVHMSPLQKGQVTAAAWCSQRKTLSRITHPHAAPCIHHGLFVGFSAPSASQRCVFAAKSLFVEERLLPEGVLLRRCPVA